MFVLRSYLKILQSNYFKTVPVNKSDLHLHTNRPHSSVGRVFAPGTGGHGFDPGPRHTNVVKMVLLLAWHSDLRGRARTGQPSVRIM